MVGVPTGGSPADHLPVVPYRFVAHRVGAVCVDGKRAQVPLGPCRGDVRRGVPADEVALVEFHEPVHARFEWVVDGPVLGGPCPEVLVKAHAVQGS